MIASRRRAHRGLFVGLALVVPLVFALALALRQQTPPPAALPGGLAARTHIAPAGVPGGELVGRGVARLAGVPFVAEARRRASGIEVDLVPQADIQKPEVLIYWRPRGATTAGKGLPGESILLGRLAGAARMRLPLPAAARPTNPGGLILYSLAHHQVLGEIPLSPIGNRGGAR